MSQTLTPPVPAPHAATAPLGPAQVLANLPVSALADPDAPKRYRTVLLFGAPGSGKGTMGKALGAIPGFVHCACGDVFRTMDMTSPIGKVFVDYSSRGLLVPDNTTIALWKESIDGLVGSRRFAPDRDYLVLDGIPRNRTQAEIMRSYINVERIFYLVCSDEKLMFERLRRRALKENRLDDASDEVIRRRWQVYEEESRAILDFYPSDLIERVDAIGSPLTVVHKIISGLVRAGING